MTLPFTLQQLRIIKAVATELSFTKAAELLFISQPSLSKQLKTLEKDGVIKRKVYTSKPPLKVEYSLTNFGETLIPLIKSIADWGDSAAQK